MFHLLYDHAVFFFVFFSFTADDAIEKTISLTQQLLKLLQMEEFPGRLKDELSNSSPKLLENLKTKGEELKTIEWFIVVAGKKKSLNDFCFP